MRSTDHWTPLAGLDRWEREQAEAIYLSEPVDGAVTDYTWSQVGDQVRRMAAHLKSLDFAPGSRIALLSKNCAHWIMADLAIWMAGHVGVPIYPSLNASTVRFILQHSETQLLFLGRLDDWPDMRAGIAEDLHLITLPRAPDADLPTGCRNWDDIVAASAPMVSTVTCEPDDLATLVYTSGSTGQPKGVMISFRAMAAGASIVGQIVEVTPRDRVLSYLPLAHVYEGALILAGSLCYGCRIYFNDTLATFMDDLQRAQPTLFQSVPRLWVKFQQGVQQKLPDQKLRRLLKLPIVGRIIRRKVLTRLGLQHVRIASSGSAPLPATVLSWYRELGLELLEGYGMSENFAYSHGSLPSRSRIGYVGHPMPGVEQRIADNGEIQIRSPGCMSGYFKDAEKTREAFTEDGWFKTGDMGEIDADGRLKITGRIKELFKTSKGKYVAPAPIENKLGSHSAVEAVCIIGANQPKPIGLVMLNGEAQRAAVNEAGRVRMATELNALMAAINATLDPHEQLAFLVVVREQWTIGGGFLTPTMKIKRGVIEQHYEPQIAAWTRARRPVIWA